MTICYNKAPNKCMFSSVCRQGWGSGSLTMMERHVLVFYKMVELEQPFLFRSFHHFGELDPESRLVSEKMYTTGKENRGGRGEKEKTCAGEGYMSEAHRP